MARNPNSEQELAITHHGGVLLSAGAGSGKTFVLVEHIVFLIKSFSLKNKILVGEQLQIALKRYLAQIVLMTFTKKAAGELSLRLKKRLDEQCALFPQESLWEIARESIGVMTVSTIHGLCHKLLTSGDIPDFDPELDITSEIDLHHKIDQLFQRWYDSLDDSIRLLPTIKTFIANRESLLSSLLGIFSAPELRLMWRNLSPKQLLGGDPSMILKDCYRLLEIDQLLHFCIAVPENGSKAKWPDYLNKFNQLIHEYPAHIVDNLQKYHVFFGENKGIRAPTKNSGFDDVILQMDKMKIFRDFISDHLDSFASFILEKDKALYQWGSYFKQIVDYIELNYRSIAGFNFSDLEYYLMLALENQDVVERLARNYRYFIVDEFQDTSYIQYHLIGKLIEGDYSRLFCVGDKKQAIYGFRGGELGVFDQCSSNIPLNLSLSNNYRSSPRVIDFNNSLFHFLFTKGMGFTGDDPFAVEVTPQLAPNVAVDESKMGRLKRIEIFTKDEEWKRFTAAQASMLEAVQFADSIEKILGACPTTSIAVLYSKLAPSRYLIALLIERGIGFTAQIKVPLSSDPVISIFKILLQVYLTQRDRPEADFWKYAGLLFKGHFHYLQMEVPSQLRSAVDQWICDLKNLGLQQSTESFFFRLGLHNSNHGNNSKLISELCRLSCGDIDRCFALLEQNSDGTYSIDFQRGHEAHRVQLMTVHASKGLEFDSVFLGGINTNGLARANSNYFGKNPGSFKWKLSSSQKMTFQTPEYILENLIMRRKDFAESKRLFYVACTRAIKEIYWVDLQNAKGAFSAGDNSWIDGLRHWNDANLGTSLAMHMASNCEAIECNQAKIDESVEGLSVKSPLFHLDSLGLTQRNSFGELGILSELSVTRLSTLVDCPRKFYLKNICKIDEKSLINIDFNSWSEADAKEEKEEILLAGTHELESIKHHDNNMSVMARGTEVHAAIEAYLKTGEASEAYAGQVQFVADHFNKFKQQEKQFEMLLEVPMKFPFFGQTINGIPDLLLLGKNPAIWDYKTGKRKKDKEQSYWFQLRCYAYALYRQGRVPKNISTTLVLLYVDQKETASIVEDFNTIETELFAIWQKSAQLDQKGHDCQFCPYQTLCSP